jgi:hypothetical protein
MQGTAGAFCTRRPATVPDDDHVFGALGLSRLSRLPW